MCLPLKISNGEDVVGTALFVPFRIGSDDYALEAKCVVRILPLVPIKLIPGAPPGVAGAFIHEGVPVPAVDLSLATLGRAAAPLLSTRILLVRPFDREPDERLLGLIAERVTDTLRLNQQSFVPSVVRSDGAPYLGPVATVGARLLQRVDVHRLLPRAVFEALYDGLKVNV